MTKQMVWDRESFDLGGPVDDVIQSLLEIKVRHGESAYIKQEFSYDWCEYLVCFKREETDAEYSARLKKEEKKRDLAAKAEAKKQEKERREYERLKHKFGENK